MPYLVEGKIVAGLEVISTQLMAETIRAEGGERERVRGCGQRARAACQEWEQEEGPLRTESDQSERLGENQENVVPWEPEGGAGGGAGEASGWIERSVQASKRPVASHI